MLKIYTKTGDNGKTFLFDKRVRKDCLEIATLGEIDELNASLGVLALQIGADDFDMIKIQIIDIQNNLFVIGASVAALDMENKNIPKLQEESVINLENRIDEMEKDLPVLKNFILPGGSIAGAQAFLTRAVCRRAEREFISLSEKYQIKNQEEIKKYLNRLSDYLFVLGRFLNKKSNTEEVIWC